MKIQSSQVTTEDNNLTFGFRCNKQQETCKQVLNTLEVLLDMFKSFFVENATTKKNKFVAQGSRL